MASALAHTSSFAAADAAALFTCTSTSTSAASSRASPVVSFSPSTRSCSLTRGVRLGSHPQSVFRVQALRQKITRRSAGERLGGATAMFTGLVEEMGHVKEVRVLDDGGFEMTIGASVVLENVSLGDSIAVNGTCLTVTRFDSSSFSVGLAPETLRKTSLGECSSGSPVNLERSLLPSTRLGGHFVQGHVDGTGTIAKFNPENDSLWVTIKTSPEILKYVVPKGYIAVDGTSLTVVDVLDDESSFTFMLVAYTQQKVILSGKQVGAKVNLEVDILGKYVERMLQGYKSPIEALSKVEA